MVAPQKLNNKDVDKSPSPEPFREPEGMVTIDLNSDSSSKHDEETKDSDDIKQKTRLKHICKTIFYLLLFITVSFSIFVFLERHTQLLKKIPVLIKSSKENNTWSNIQYEQIFKNKFMSDDKQHIVKCVLSQTLEDCCNIFTEDDVNFPELAEICSVSHILDLIHTTFDIQNDMIRTKRNPQEESSEEIVSREHGTVLDQYINDIDHIVTQQFPETLHEILRDDYENYDEYDYPNQRLASRDYLYPRNSDEHFQRDAAEEEFVGMEENYHDRDIMQNNTIDTGDRDDFVHNSHELQYSFHNNPDRVPQQENSFVHETLQPLSSRPEMPEIITTETPPIRYDYNDDREQFKSEFPYPATSNQNSPQMYSNNNVLTMPTEAPHLIHQQIRIEPNNFNPRIIGQSSHMNQDQPSVVYTEPPPIDSNIPYQQEQMVPNNISSFTMDQSSQINPEQTVPIPFEFPPANHHHAEPEKRIYRYQNIPDNPTDNFTGTSPAPIQLGHESHNETTVQQFEETTTAISHHNNKSANARANQQEEIVVKTKSDFPVIDLQTGQQVLMNPCLFPYQNYINPFATPYKIASPFDGSQILKVVPTRSSQYVINPAMYPYMQMPFMQVPQFLPNNAQIQPPNGNGQIQATGAGGQFYVCNPLPAVSNNLAALPGVEIRREALQLQDALQNFPQEKRNSNSTRASEIICPNGQFACEDGSRCVPKYKVCDNEIQCDDGSDEWYCSCKDRVGRLRLCDGYFDCPNGEDEQGCFGCTPDEFSCDDWSRFRKSTCIPIEQRCDNVKQCAITGKDEEDCSVLASHVGNQPLFKISSAVGYLHRNYRGKWYPTCFGTEIWAVDVCKTEGGPSTINPRSHMMLTEDNYEGSFINILPNNEISLVRTCVKDRAAFVECPPMFCGLRMTTKNPYRTQEVDTSAEEVVNELERIVAMIRDIPANQSKSEEDPVLGAGRVVGGKPSQPAAWPWLVSIYKNGIFHCGGVLINEQWVVTAAHCLHKYWQYYYEIQAGMLRRFSFSPMEQRRWAVTVVQHESYDKATLRNDIGLIKLSSPVRFNRYVRPICLPSEATAGRNFLDGPPVNSICTTVGWGATIEHGADPDHMREVEVPVLSHCKHPDDQQGDEICAGLSEGGKDACQGDSGGPFMCRNPNNPSQWYLAGIVSHGEGCARPNEPGVYTKVSRFVGWIVENIGDFKTTSKIPLQRCPGFVCKGTEKCLPKKHHCDKIVDCLFGDDENGCNFGFHDIFKHADPYLGSRHNESNEDDSATQRAASTHITEIFNSNGTSILTPNNEYNLNDNAEKKLEVNEGGNATTNTINKTNIVTKRRGNRSDVFFKCEKMLQLIPLNKKCDKKFDCEDGTDELNCLCINYIKNYDPSAICDGITDCFDLSDENMCVECNKTSEYHCRQSRTCIDLVKRCNGVADCTKGEDELDCAALTDGSTLTLDSDLRPELAMSGIITINRFGVWRPFCANGLPAIGHADGGPSQNHHHSAIATNVCNLLGFEEYVGYKEHAMEDRPLNVTVVRHSRQSITNGDTSPNPNSTCDGLYVKCSNVSLDSSLHSVYLDNVTRDVELYTSPWNAVIYADGIFRCMATILNSNWIVTSVNCFEGITTIKKHYIVALMGKGKGQLLTKGPYEVISRIVQVSPIEKSDIVLLRLENPIIFNRYIKAADINTRRNGRRKERCVAVGLHNNRTKFFFMSPIENCYVGYRCFESKHPEEDCQNNSAWSGTIVCDSGSGWYPAAVYSENKGHCGLSTIKNYTSIKYFKNMIAAVIQQAPIDVDAPRCEGFRCQLGECLDKKKVCNGIPECRGGEDEDADLCYQKEMQCHLSGKCECETEDLKCNNNKCISKTLFCDRKNDCEDGEDEPDICSCRNYLKLTNPERICDGVVNCLDRTDEDPSECKCKIDSFKCNNSSNTCISNQMVCDGIPDCQDGEDEKKCISILGGEHLGSNAGEVFTRTGGIWHPGCFHQNNTLEELQEICTLLGFKGTNPNQLKPARGVDNPVVRRPVIDPFGFVWIHKQPGNKLILGIRTGNEPYVKFVEDPNCYRLFLACM